MSDIGKTLRFLKRNGIVRTVYAVKERVDEKKTLSYQYTPITEEERLYQLEDGLNYRATFSIVVPACETPENYLRAMVDSVVAQTYPKWELIIADASSTDLVNKVISSYEDIRIRYVKLKENSGISGNTNEALKLCTGEYTGLLDHDDLLTKDALYQAAGNIGRAEEYGIKLQMFYSDEDKTDSENTAYFEINKKPKFNLDLILSNNYICHFLILKTDLIRDLEFRSAYDGAQDHDLILRAVAHLRKAHGADYELYIYHIDRVLYHWRAHERSTASNPGSKLYAYEAGRHAVMDFLASSGIEASVTHSAHLGFFDVTYDPDIFAQRPEVAAVGGRILNRKKRVIGGAYDEDRHLMFEGMSFRNSGGYLHRASCRMEVPYLDVGCMRFSPHAEPGEEDRSPVRILNRMIEENKKADKPLSDRELSFRFCDTLRDMGYHLIYDPEILIREKD